MTALSAPRVTSPREKIVRRAAVQLAAGVKAYQGAAAMIITSGTGKGYYAPAAAGKVGDVEGRFLETVDNTLGAAGAASAQIEFGHDREIIPFVNDSGAPLAAADRGGPAYALDGKTCDGAMDASKVKTPAQRAYINEARKNFEALHGKKAPKDCRVCWLHPETTVSYHAH